MGFDHAGKAREDRVRRIGRRAAHALLSLCFCRACESRYAAVGIDSGGLAPVGTRRCRRETGSRRGVSRQRSGGRTGRGQDRHRHRCERCWWLEPGRWTLRFGSRNTDPRTHGRRGRLPPCNRRWATACPFFTRALRHGLAPVEVTTDKAGPYLRVIDDLVPAAAHVTGQYANNRAEADHARLKARLRPMRGLKQLRSATQITAGHAFVQNLRRGHYELATDAAPPLRLAHAFTELALAM